MKVNLIKKHPKYSICLVSIILATTLFIVFIDSYYDSFKNNIIPEIVGIAIELVIIIFVLGLFTSKQETNRRRQLEKRARDYLRFVIINLLKNESLYIKVKKVLPSIVEYEVNKNNFKFLAKDKNRSDEVIDALIVALALVETQVYDDIQENIKSDLMYFHSLTPILAEVSDEHFKTWGRIIHFLTKVVDKKNVAADTIKILQKIKHFDQLTHNQFKNIF